VLGSRYLSNYSEYGIHCCERFITSAEGGYVCFGLFVCLSVRQITEKVVNGYWRNFMEGYGMAQGPISSILVTIRITVRIQESEVRNPDSLDYRKSYQRILMKFYGELGCGLVTFWWRSASLSGSGSPFRITIRIREELPRCQWRSAEVCALWVLLVKIGPHLPKLVQKLNVHIFYGRQCIHLYTAYNGNKHWRRFDAISKIM